MVEIEPLIPGIYARSETLVQTTRDHDRDRVDDETLREDQRRDLEDLVGAQTSAGFTTVSPGLLTWQDHFRPFEHLIDGLGSKTLTRFIDTNTFYRRPDVEGEVTLDRSELSTFAEAHVPELGPVDGLATLPAPTAWVSACRDEDGDYPDPQLATEIAEAVYPEVLDLHADRGYTKLALVDPWLSRHPEPGQLFGSIEALADAEDSGLELILQLPFQDAGPLLHDVDDLPVDGVAVDRVETAHEDLDALGSTAAIGLGLVDARSSLVERDDLLLSSLGRAVEELDAGTIYLTPTGDLQHVPETIARRKVRVLGEVANAAREKFGADAR